MMLYATEHRVDTQEMLSMQFSHCYRLVHCSSACQRPPGFLLPQAIEDTPLVLIIYGLNVNSFAVIPSVLLSEGTHIHTHTGYIFQPIIFLSTALHRRCRLTNSSCHDLQTQIGS